MTVERRMIDDLLAEHPFFAGLRADWAELVAGCGTNVAFDEGERIFAEGDPADTFYVLRRGIVALEIAAPRRDPVVIEPTGPGEILGVWWLLPLYRYNFDAEARRPVGAIELDAACLRGKCDDDPELGYDLYKRFAGLMRERLQAARIQLLDLYGTHVS